MKKWHLWLAASIGLVVIVGMMIREFDVDALGKVELSPRFFLGVGLAVLLFVLQNLMLSLRFRHLCQRKLSLAQSFRIDVLCEFTSAVTPSAVGGSVRGRLESLWSLGLRQIGCMCYLPAFLNCRFVCCYELLSSHASKAPVGFFVAVKIENTEELYFCSRYLRNKRQHIYIFCTFTARKRFVASMGRTVN